MCAPDVHRACTEMPPGRGACGTGTGARHPAPAPRAARAGASRGRRAPGEARSGGAGLDGPRVRREGPREPAGPGRSGPGGGIGTAGGVTSVVPRDCGAGARSAGRHHRPGGAVETPEAWAWSRVHRDRRGTGLGGKVRGIAHCPGQLAGSRGAGWVIAPIIGRRGKMGASTHPGWSEGPRRCRSRRSTGVSGITKRSSGPFRPRTGGGRSSRNGPGRCRRAGSGRWGRVGFQPTIGVDGRSES
jgi:hypothetical protein